MKKQGLLSKAAILRQKAEAQQEMRQAKTSMHSSEIDKLKLIHELEVHQIELEMQNEELIEAKEKAELIQEKYAELYDFAPSGYLTLTKEGEIVQLNFVSAKMLDKERSNLINSRFALFVSANTRSDFNLFLQKLSTSNVKQSCDIVIEAEGNLPIYVNVDGIISPNKDFYLLTLVDISKRKLSELNLLKEKEKTEFSESKYSGIVNRVADAIFSYNPDNFEIIEANEATSKIYGYDKGELIGMSALKFSAEVEKSKTTSNEIQQKGEFFVNVRHHKKKDGTDIFVKIQGYKIFINEKPIIFAVCHDITDIKKTQEELIKAKEKAEESDRLKSAFLANMSHEIRTPMSGILGFAGLLKTVDLENEKQQEYIRIIEKSGERLLNIINDIIDISKIESGQMSVCVSELDLNKCLGDCYSFFKPEAKKKNIELRLTMGLYNKEAVIKSDPEKLNGILTNLVKNAIKYTMHGSIEIGYVLNRSKTQLEFYVKDTGIGVSKERQTAIFDRFVQADIEDKMAREGAGLGLTISKAYADLLEGKLWLESEVNVGSTFHFTLRYKTVADTEIVPSELINDKQKLCKNLKVLIVEDDEISTQLLEITLRNFSEDIITVVNGADAIEACKSNPDIDLVLMDIHLPTMDGYEASKQIRKFNTGVIIIAQTAYALYGDREIALAAGCNDYISKPLLKGKLDAIIRKYF